MSTLSLSLRVPSPWRVALPAVIALQLLIVLLFRDTLGVMVGIWHRSETFAHAFLVLPISLWLVWRLRHKLASMTPRPAPIFLLPMAILAAGWLLSDLMVVNAASQFAFVGLLCLAVPAVLGLQIALAMLFPLLFLFFMVPFGEFMLPQMMEWTADFVVGALRLSGIPVFREGLQFVIPSGNWSVVTECSGVRYLIASFMVGSLFAYLNYQSTTKRVVFMLVSLLTPIVANWLRAYFIVMLGHLSGNKLATGVDHLLYGWVFFGVVIFVMFSIGMRWADADADDLREGGAARAAGVPPAAPALLAALLGAALVAAAPHGIVWSLNRSDRAAAPPELTLPSTLGSGWVGIAQDPVAAWTPDYKGAMVQARQVYQGPGGQVGVYIAYYRAQNEDRKLVSSTNGIVWINDRTWTVSGTGARDVAVGPGRATLRTHDILGPGGGRSVTASDRPHLAAWQTYWIDGRLIPGDLSAKIAGGLSRLQGHGDDGAVIVLYTEQSDFARGHSLVESFAQAHLPTLTQLLQRTRDRR